jgi:hypothetical protein
MVLAVALLAGCTSKAPSAADDQTPANVLLQQAVTNLGQAASYHVKGSTSDGATTADLDLVYAGDRREGTWSRNGAQAQFVQLGDVTYLKADSAFWQPFADNDPAHPILTLAGRWVQLDSDPTAISESLAPSITDLLALGSNLSRGKVGTFDGKVATTVSDGTTTVYIVLDQPRYPVRIQSEGGTTLDLSDFGAAASIDPPAADQVIALSSVTGS